MNHIYRIVFNRSQGVFQVVSENARGQGKGSRRLKPAANHRSPSVLLKAAALVMAMAGICSAQPAWAQIITVSGDVTPDTIPPAPLPWDVVGDLFVGWDELGTLDILEGAEVSSNAGYLGYNPGSNGTVTVSGNGSTWTNRSDLLVGISGTGTLNILDGGDVSNGAGYLGREPGGNGTVTVSGNGSTWTNRSDLYVGRSGTGTLNIKEGGTVTSKDGRSGVGGRGDSIGVVNVSGNGSAWNANRLSIGNEGAGTLNIMEGASVNNGQGAIGVSLGGHGIVNVSGDGSAWRNAAELLIGQAGTGTLNILDGGEVSNDAGYLGLSSGSNGTATVSGIGSTWTNRLPLSVGISGTGTLNILDGGDVSNDAGTLGAYVGSNGTATVSGTGSTWKNRSSLSVGTSGTGTLNILDGAEVSNDAAGYLGAKVGSNGTATVSGIGSTWKNRLSLSVGTSGTGTLNIEKGGMVTSENGRSRVGDQGDSIGVVNVSGNGSAWNADVLSIGSSGAGTLNILDGGKVSNEEGHIGYNPGSNGTATVSGNGSTWTNSSDLYVGYSGTGTLNIEKGGTVISDRALIGDDQESNGVATVSGIGSTWTNSSYFSVGNNGTGTLNIEKGGTVTSKDGRSGVGDGADSIGIVNVSGNGSAWNVSYLSIGFFGAGTLNITEGASVNNRSGFMGWTPAGHGTVNVSGDGSAWHNTAELTVGQAGTGTLNILGGGEVSNSLGYLGYDPKSNGTATVSGIGSTWTNSSYLSVGILGTGTLSIADTGRVVVGSGVGITNLAYEPPSTGTINIGASSALPSDATGAGTIETAGINFGAGTATLNFNHTDSNYEFATPLRSVAAGTHRLNHYAGTTRLTGDSSGFTGATTVMGGTLVVGMGGVGKLGGTLTVGNGATLQGTGTVGTTTLQRGATIAPGNSIGTLNVAGDLHFLPGSVFRIEANDQGQADKVMVAGTADLAGTVQVQASGAAFTPRTDYTILSAGTLVGQFDAATVNTNYEFLQPELSYTNTDVSLALVRKTKPEPEPDPKPGPMQFHDAAVSDNQYATADGIESLPDTNPVYRQIETLASGRAPQALDALSGELHASTQAALLAIADTPRERLFSHLRANFRADTATDAAKPIHPLWAEVSTRQLRLGNEAHIAQARLNSTSLTVGADVTLGKDWRAGAALHYDNGKIKVNDRSSQSDLESVGLTLGAGRAIALADGQLNLMAGASYAWHRLKSRRYTGESGLDQTLKASYNGNTSQVFGELGYALPLTLDSTLEPFAGLAWTRIHTKGFTESGGSAALSGQSQSTQTTASTLGLRTQVRLPMGSGQATLQASAGWRHAFGDVQPQTWLAFDGGQSFTVQGAPIARDAAVLGLGVTVNLSSNATLGVSYVGQFGNDGQRDNAGELKLRWAF